MIKRILRNLLTKEEVKLHKITQEFKEKHDAYGYHWLETYEAESIVLQSKISMFKIDVYKSLINPK